jgi:hypothetical protein
MVGDNVVESCINFIGMINIRRAYFHGRHVDIVWYGGKKRKRRDCALLYYIKFFFIILIYLLFLKGKCMYH